MRESMVTLPPSLHSSFFLPFASFQFAQLASAICKLTHFDNFLVAKNKDPMETQRIPSPHFFLLNYVPDKGTFEIEWRRSFPMKCSRGFPGQRVNPPTIRLLFSSFVSSRFVLLIVFFCLCISLLHCAFKN